MFVRLDVRCAPVSPYLASSLPSARRWHNCRKWPNSREQFWTGDYCCFSRSLNGEEGIRDRPSDWPPTMFHPHLFSSSSLRRNCLNFIVFARPSAPVRGQLKNSDRAFDFTLETTIALLLPRACPPRRQSRCRRLGRPRPSVLPPPHLKSI